MQCNRFVTGSEPWCVWDWNLKELTTTFLKTFDATYFEYLAKLHTERLEGEDARHAATAIRTTYCHAMETLFALLCAIAQAPRCIPGWIQKYRPKDLYQLVEKINNGHDVHSKIRDKPLTWRILADITLQCLSLPDKEKEQRIKDGFSTFWSHLAHEFLRTEIRAEYNSIKHGFRISSGASWIAVGEEEVPGVPCPPEKMRVVGGGEFGSTFFEPDDLCKYNFRLVRRSVNWDPYALAGRIRLISISLRNLVAFLSIAYGAEPGSVQFCWLEELNLFDKVWQGPSLYTSSVSMVIEMKDIQPRNAEEILSVYASQVEPEKA